MDRRERSPDQTELLLAALEGWQAGMWTAMPGIIRSFDAAKMTCTASVSIKVNVRKPDGSFEWVEIAPLVDVPVVFPGGGGFTLTFPVAAGDEALIVFASRCIDAWWQSGGVQVQADTRMHTLSDGFALVGVRSQPRRFNVNTSAAELRSDDGDTLVRVGPGNDVTVTAPGTITLNAASVVINSNVTVNGTVVATGNVTGAGISLSTHKHGGVQTGGGQTGVPV